MATVPALLDLARAHRTPEDGPGAFRRTVADFRDDSLADVSGRYHLYVSLACPWAHRTLIVRALKGLEEAITVTVVDPIRDARGWRFTDEPDPIAGATFLSEIYRRSDPGFDGYVSVPVLWDRGEERIAGNESSELIVLLNRDLNGVATRPEVDLYPEPLRCEIDLIDDYVYDAVNNGVYRCGFAQSQEAYEQAFHALFEALDALDAHLADRRYLVGGEITLADVRLFTTLVRFDPVYYVHFKANRRLIRDFDSLSGYLRDLYQTPGFGSTTDFDQIKRHYYGTHPQINPLGIVPAGPEIDLDAPHDRAALTG
jgi:glutathionyl-hydroquinone reductase